MDTKEDIVTDYFHGLLLLLGTQDCSFFYIHHSHDHHIALHDCSIDCFLHWQKCNTIVLLLQAWIVYQSLYLCNQLRKRAFQFVVYYDAWEHQFPNCQTSLETIIHHCLAQLECCDSQELTQGAAYCNFLSPRGMCRRPL